MCGLDALVIYMKPFLFLWLSDQIQEPYKRNEGLALEESFASASNNRKPVIPSVTERSGEGDLRGWQTRKPEKGSSISPKAKEDADIKMKRINGILNSNPLKWQ